MGPAKLLIAPTSSAIPASPYVPRAGSYGRHVGLQYCKEVVIVELWVQVKSSQVDYGAVPFGFQGIAWGSTLRNAHKGPSTKMMTLVGVYVGTLHASWV